MASILKVNEIQSTSGNTGFTIATDGTPLPKACAFQMYASSAQSITGSTEMTYEWDTVGFDTHSITDASNNRVVITDATAGIWFLSFTSRLNNSVPFRHINYIKVNSNTPIMFEETMYSQTTGASSSCTASGFTSLVSGDVIIGRIYQQHSTTNTEYGISAGRLEGFRIGTT
jgi:hypothetical protein